MITASRGCGDLLLLTWRPARPQEASATVLGAAYRELAGTVAAAPAVVLQERIFGTVAAAPASLAERRAALGGAAAFAVQPTWVEGMPCGGGDVAGVHVVAARAGSTTPQPLQWRGRPCGWVVEGHDAAYLGLADVGSLLADKGCRGPIHETAAVLDLAAEILAAAGFAFTDVLRTWFYLDRILDWYGEFNRVRNEVYRRLGVLNGTPTPRIPASTGIRGRGLRGSWCTLDLIAAQPLRNRSLSIERLASPRQPEAPDYGSAFSRGLAVCDARSRCLLVSGTAAIDAVGASCHPGEFSAQVEHTFDTVAALLEEAGGGLDDVAQATAFVKRPADAPVLTELLGRRGLDGLPLVTVTGDVCRDELLFELDATAVRPVTEPADGA